MVAPKFLIWQVTELSKFTDSYGNTVLERAIAMLFDDGEVRRHLKKATKTYRERRDVFCKLLEEKLGDYISFKKPEGGLTVWVKFKPAIDAKKVYTKALEIGVRFPNPTSFSTPNRDDNATRLGFASLKTEEMPEVIYKLEKVLKEMV